MENGHSSFAPPPPPGPPPLLSEQQLIHLARQGWLCIDLPDAVSQSVREVFQKAPTFFAAPSQHKAELYPSKQGTEFGYYPVENEKEYVTFRCHVHGSSDSRSATTTMTSATPSSTGQSTTTSNGSSSTGQATVTSTTPSSSLAAAIALESTIAQAWREAGLFLYRILCDISRASDLDFSVWDDILDGTLTLPPSEDQVTYTLMRLFQYLPTTGFAGEHTDLGILTLCVGDGAGLQVLDRHRSTRDIPAWVDAPVGVNKGTVLIGQTLRMLSSNTVNTGVHRVVGNPRGRSSVVYALRHSNRHNIDFGRFGSQEGLLTPAELWKKVQFGKVNINSVKEKREQMRAKFRAEKSKNETAQNEDLVTGQG